MGNIDDKGTTVKNAGETSQKSKIDSLSGNHTTSIIVAVLFLIVFIGLVIIIILKDNIDSSQIITGIFSLLSLLAGFFAGSQMGRVNNNQQ